MSRPHAQIDLRRPFYSAAHDEGDDESGGEEGEGQGYRVAEPNAPRRRYDDDGDAMVVVDEDEEVDFEGYEQYLAELKSKAEARPQSARVLRSMPTESPQFYMVNAHNPSFPTVPPPNPRPTRPTSARPRLNCSSGAKSALSSAAAPVNQTPRAPQSASCASIGVRRKRQQGGDNFVNARVRAIYHDTGRAAPVVKQMPSSVSATATISNKLKIFQQAELHDEYYKLVDVVTELKTACQQEQERRMKAVSRIRRLEEIVAMKDRKIESLLHAKSVGSRDHIHLVGAITQREMAQRDRQNNAMLLKLKHKIAQQSQIISSYEEAMQSLRSGIKATNLMELEEERNQLYLELRNLQELLGCARLESESQAKKINELFQVEGNYRQQIAKLQQENKKCAHEKQKCDQELAFFKSRIDQLQEKLAHEQRKRAYDREISSGDGAGGSYLISPSRGSVLASALEEMKELMKKECMASIQREKLKSPRSVSSKSPRYTIGGGTTVNPMPVAAQPPATAQPPSQRMVRPQSAGPTRPHRTTAPSSLSTTTAITIAGKPPSSSYAAPSEPNCASTGDKPKQSSESDQHFESKSEQVELREEREENSSRKLVGTSDELVPDTIPTSSPDQINQAVVVIEPREQLASGIATGIDEERRTIEEVRLVDAPAAEMNTVESKLEAQPVSEDGGDGESEKEKGPLNGTASTPDGHDGSQPSRQELLGVSKTAAEGDSSESVEPDEELRRRAIAEVSWLVQEMRDTGVDGPLLTSDSSEEFLQFDELQREQLDAQVTSKEQQPVPADVNEHEKSGSSSSSSSSSPSSEAGSPLPHSSLLQSTDKDGEALTSAATEPSPEAADADAAAAMMLELQALGLLKASASQGSGVSASGSGSAPSSGELMYDSDFTENDNDNENEDDAEDLE